MYIRTIIILQLSSSSSRSMFFSSTRWIPKLRTKIKLCLMGSEKLTLQIYESQIKISKLTIMQWLHRTLLLPWRLLVIEWQILRTKIKVTTHAWLMVVLKSLLSENSLIVLLKLRLMRLKSSKKDITRPRIKRPQRVNIAPSLTPTLKLPLLRLSSG